MGGTIAPLPPSRPGEKDSQCRLHRAFDAYARQRHTARSVKTFDSLKPSTACGGESAPSACCAASSINESPGLGCAA